MRAPKSIKRAVKEVVLVFKDLRIATRTPIQMLVVMVSLVVGLSVII